MSEQANEYGPVATRMIFDNDDVRVWEMDLAPGAVCGLHHHTEGGPVKMVELVGEGEEHTREESLSAGAVLWLRKGTHRGLVNVGTQRYRQIAVELK